MNLDRRMKFRATRSPFFTDLALVWLFCLAPLVGACGGDEAGGGQSADLVDPPNGARLTGRATDAS